LHDEKQLDALFFRFDSLNLADKASSSPHKCSPSPGYWRLIPPLREQHIPSLAVYPPAPLMVMLILLLIMETPSRCISPLLGKFLTHSQWVNPFSPEAASLSPKFYFFLLCALRFTLPFREQSRSTNDRWCFEEYTVLLPPSVTSIPARCIHPPLFAVNCKFHISSRKRTLQVGGLSS